MSILPFGYAQSIALLLAGFLEGLGVPWPGAVIVAAAGVAAGGSWEAVGAAAGLFAGAYCAGASVQYAAGRLLGPLAFKWVPTALRGRLGALTARHGSAVVLWSRPFAIGNYVSLPAGIVRMPLARFLLYTGIGVWPWAFVMALAGHYLGGWSDQVTDLVSQWTLPAAVGLGAAALLVAGWKLLRRNRSHEPADSLAG